MIPDRISAKDVIKALDEIDRNGVPKRRESTKYLLKYNGKYYPPKYVISIANKYLNKNELGYDEFHGGYGTNNFLERLGFNIVEKDDLL